MPDKYHGGVPTDRLRAFRERRKERPPSIWASVRMALVVGMLVALHADSPVPGLTAIANPTGAFQGTVQTPPTQDQETLTLLGSGSTFAVAPPSGVVATDTANIQSALAAAAAAGGGEVQLQSGIYQVKSSLRADTGCTYTSSSQTWSDASITAADLGKYVLAGQQQNRVAQIRSVVAGTSFKTDAVPGSNITAETFNIVQPAFVLPEGVQLRGRGSVYTTGPSGNFASGTANSTTQIVDTGTGVTCLIRGAGTAGAGTTQAARYQLQQLSIWGLTSGTPGTNYGSTFCGVYVGNQANWLTVDNCDFQFHGTAALMTDANMNALDIRDCGFSNNGTPTTTTPGGGIVVGFFNNTASCGCNVYNCYFDGNYGAGISFYISGQGTGAYGVNCIGCQFIGTQASDWSTYTGYGAVVQTGGFGATAFFGCWFESNVNGGLWVDGSGGVSCNACEFKDTNGGTVYGILNLSGCYIYESNGDCFVNNGTINWMGCSTAGAVLYSGGPTGTALKGVGSSAGVYLNNTAYTNP